MDERYAKLTDDLTPLPNEFEIQTLSQAYDTLSMFADDPAFADMESRKQGTSYDFYGRPMI